MALPRHGRRTRLTGDRREALWRIFASARDELARRQVKTYAEVLHDVAEALGEREDKPFDHIVVDEAQDIDVAELRLLKAACGRQQNGLFFAGDIGQRIFRPAFSWAAEGVEIRGRSRNLKVNYRTSYQIRRHSDLLLPSRLLELDGSEEDRTGVQSVFEGPPPEIRAFQDSASERVGVAKWIAQVREAGILPHEVCLLVRSGHELDRARKAAESAHLEPQLLVAKTAPDGGKVAIATMHLAKGLEFRAVAVIACDADVIPSKERLLEANDETALDEVYATERHLLYVACTRPREHLLVSGVRSLSEFLEDLALSGSYC